MKKYLLALILVLASISNSQEFSNPYAKLKGHEDEAFYLKTSNSRFIVESVGARTNNNLKKIGIDTTSFIEDLSEAFNEFSLINNNPKSPKVKFILSLDSVYIKPSILDGTGPIYVGGGWGTIGGFGESICAPMKLYFSILDLDNNIISRPMYFFNINKKVNKFMIDDKVGQCLTSFIEIPNINIQFPYVRKISPISDFKELSSIGRFRNKKFKLIINKELYNTFKEYDQAEEKALIDDLLKEYANSKLANKEIKDSLVNINTIVIKKVKLEPNSYKYLKSNYKVRHTGLSFLTEHKDYRVTIDIINNNKVLLKDFIFMISLPQNVDITSKNTVSKELNKQIIAKNKSSNTLFNKKINLQIGGGMLYNDFSGLIETTIDFYLLSHLSIGAELYLKNSEYTYENTTHTENIESNRLAPYWNIRVGTYFISPKSTTTSFRASIHLAYGKAPEYIHLNDIEGFNIFYNRKLKDEYRFKAVTTIGHQFGRSKMLGYYMSGVIDFKAALGLNLGLNVQL